MADNKPKLQNYDDLLASGLKPVASPAPMINGRVNGPVPPPTVSSMSRTMVGTLPGEMQLDADFANQQYNGQIPVYRLMPPASSGKSSVNATVVSGTTKIAATANQANQTASTANSTANTANSTANTVAAVPVLQTTGGGGAIQSKPIIGGSPTAVSQDNLNDGVIFARVNGSNLTANDVDLAKSGVQGKILDNIGDTATYGRTLQTALTSNQVDLAKSGVTNKVLTNIADDATYGKTLQTALTSNQIDFSKSGFQNKNLDNVGDGTSFVRLASTHAAANVSYNFQGTWSSATAYVIADEVTFNNIYWIALANNTNSQPATSNANWQAVGRIQGDLQIFTLNGTWNKPAAGQFAFITVIGGGGNGGTGFRGTSEFGGGGGGAGGVSKQLLPLSVLGATENVIVGTAGGASSFGSWLKATGGGNGGNATSGGVGSAGATGQGTESGQLTFVGGSGGVGGSGTGTGGTGTAGSSATPNGYAGGTGGVGSGVAAGAAGNPGTNSSANEPSGGGGGGGGGASAWNNAGGTGGVGGAGGNYGAGGGGGGGSFGAAAGVGGTGAAGIVVIACF